MSRPPTNGLIFEKKRLVSTNPIFAGKVFGLNREKIKLGLFGGPPRQASVRQSEFPVVRASLHEMLVSQVSSEARTQGQAPAQPRVFPTAFGLHRKKGKARPQGLSKPGFVLVQNSPQ